MQFFRNDEWQQLLLDPVKSSAMDHPYILVFRFFGRQPSGDFFQLRKAPIKPAKIIRRADPQYAGEYMRPAQHQITPFSKVHRKNLEYPALSSAKAYRIACAASMPLNRCPLFDLNGTKGSVA